MLNKILSLLLLSVLGLALAGTAQAQPAERPDIVELDRIVAVVNDEVITLHELRSRISETFAQMRSRNVTPPPAEEFERQQLERMILEKVQLQHAAETQLRVDDRLLDASLSRIAESNRMDVPQLRAAIEQDGMAWTRFREDIRKQIVMSRLRDREVESRVVVTEGEIANFIANPERKPDQNEE